MRTWMMPLPNADSAERVKKLCLTWPTVTTFNLLSSLFSYMGGRITRQKMICVGLRYGEVFTTRLEYNTKHAHIQFYVYSIHENGNLWREG